VTPWSPTVWRVQFAVRGHDASGITEVEVGDVVVETGADDRVGDLVLALARHAGPEIVPPDLEWAALELADGTLVDADGSVAVLPVTDGDRLVVVVAAAGSAGGRDAAAFGAPMAPVRRFALVPVEAEGSSGATIPLAVGRAVVGRGDDADVAFVDPSVSRRHARLDVGDGVVVGDLGSTNGTFVDEVEVEEAVRVPVGSRLRFGDVEADVVAMPTVAGAAVGPGSVDDRIEAVPLAPPVNGRRTVSPSPEFVDEVVDATVVLPEVPPAPERPRLSWWSVMVPVALAGALMLVPLAMGEGGGTYAVVSCGFLVIGPAMIVVGHLEARRSVRRNTRHRQATFEERLAEAGAVGERLRAEELARLLAASPPPADVAARAHHPALGLWSAATVGVGTVRVGVVRRPTALRFERSDGGPVAGPSVDGRDPVAAAALAALVADLGHHREAPMSIPLDRPDGGGGTIAITGDPGAAEEAARALLLRLVTVLPPSRLSLAVLASDDVRDRWDDLKWCPHQVVAVGPSGPDALPPATGVTRRVVLLDRRTMDAGDAVSCAAVAATDARTVLVWLGGPRH